MESLIDLLFGIIVIAICVVLMSMENIFLALVLGLVFFVSIIVGGIYATGKALDEISKFKK